MKTRNCKKEQTDRLNMTKAGGIKLHRHQNRFLKGIGFGRNTGDEKTYDSDIGYICSIIKKKTFNQFPERKEVAPKTCHLKIKTEENKHKEQSLSAS